MGNLISTDATNCIGAGVEIQGKSSTPDESRVCHGRRPSEVSLFLQVFVEKLEDTFNFKYVTSGMYGEFE